MCLGYTAKSRDCQYCVIVIALCPSYCDIVLFLFVLLLFAGLLVAKTGLRCRPRALLDPSPKQGITKALWSIQRKGFSVLQFSRFQNPLIIKRDPLPKKLHTLLKSRILDYNEGWYSSFWSERSKN